MKQFAYGTVGYSVVTLALAAPWHFKLFKELYDSLGIYDRAEPIIALGIATILVQGAVMSWLYPKAFPRERSLRTALAFCGAIGVFLFSVSTMANAAKMQVSSLPAWFAVQAAFHAIQFTLAGFVFAWAFREDSHGL